MKTILLAILAMTLIFVLSVPVIVINTIRKIYRRESLKHYFYVIAIGFDQAGGSIIYGQEDWTVSSWTYHLHRSGNNHATTFMSFIDGVFGDGHCEESFFNEAQKMNFKPEWM